MRRRDFLRALAAASAAGLPLERALGADAAGERLYDGAGVPFGNVALLHFTDCHAQLMPEHFREPSVNLGVGAARGKPPHLVGEALLKQFGIAPGTREAHAFSNLDFVAAAARFGTTGGFAHLATLVTRMKASRPGALVLDGGDTWQGSATSLWTQGQDMIDAAKLLGVDVMTGALGIHLRRGARAGGDRQGSRRPHRLRRAQREDAGLRRSGVRAVRDPRRQRRQRGGHRPGVPLHTHRQPALLHPRLDLRHPGGEPAEDDRRGAREGRGRGGAAVAQRHGRRPEARVARARARRHPRRPHPRRHAAADAGRQCAAAARS